MQDDKKKKKLEVTAKNFAPQKVEGVIDTAYPPLKGVETKPLGSVPSAVPMKPSSVPAAKLKMKMQMAKKKPQGVDAVTEKDGAVIKWKAGSNPAADEREIKKGTFKGSAYSEILKKQKRK